jgi:uncharacterized protein YjdB
LPEKGILFSRNTATSQKGSAYGGAIYNEGALLLKRGAASFEYNLATSARDNAEAFGGAIYLEKPAQVSGPVFFSGNRVKPENSYSTVLSFENHIAPWPCHIVTFSDIDPLLGLSIDGNEPTLSGASYVMTENSFDFSLKLATLYENSLPTVFVNGATWPEVLTGSYSYKIDNNQPDKVEEFKVAVKLLHPVNFAVDPVLLRYFSFSVPLDKDGKFQDAVSNHASSYKFTITGDFNDDEPLHNDYVVSVNGQILDRNSSRVKRIAYNKYEYTISSDVITAYDVRVSSAIDGVNVIFKAPPAGVDYLIDGKILDIHGTDTIIPYFAGYNINFVVKHNDEVFFPPTVRYKGIELRRTFWEIIDERHFTAISEPGGVISVDLPPARVSFSIALSTPPQQWVALGGEMCFSYRVRPVIPGLNIPIKWEVSDTSVIKIVAFFNGQSACIVGNKVGTARIKASLVVDGGSADSIEVEVREITPGSGTVYILKGASRKLSSVIPQAQWRSEDLSIATVNPEGELYGVAPGEARLVYATGTQIWEIWTVFVIDRKDSGKQIVLKENTTYSLPDLLGINNVKQWVVSDPLVAFIQQDTLLHTTHYGKISLYEAGTEGGFDAFVARIELEKASGNPLVGDTVFIGATVYPEQLAQKTIAWTTSHISIAEKIGANNTGAGIRMKAAGEAYVQAALTAYPDINASILLSTLNTIQWRSTPPKFLVPDEIVTLSASLDPWPVDDFLVWDTLPGNNAAATILSQTGQIKAQAIGQAKIRVSSRINPAQHLDTDIAVVKLAFETTRTTFAIGDIGSLSLSVHGRNNGLDTLELLSLRPDVLSVSKSRIVSGERVFLSALAPGIVTLTAQIKGFPNTKTTLTAQVVELELPTRQITVLSGDLPFSLMPKITPGNLLTWHSTNPQVASVHTHQGIVTPQRAGTAFIVAELFENEGDESPVVSASCEVTVVEESFLNGILVGVAPQMTGLAVVSPFEVYEVGKGYQLAIEKEGEIFSEAPEMSWESGLPEHVSINSATGWMIPLLPGPASIKVIFNGIIKTYSFNVVAPADGGILLKETALTLNEGEKRSIAYELTPAGNHYGTIQWTSSDQAVSVDHNGLVTANFYGQACIKAILYRFDGSIADSAFCLVKVASESVGFVLSDTIRILSGKGQTFMLRVDAMPTGVHIGRAYFVSSNPVVASIKMKAAANALITANSGGATDIAVYVQGVPGLVRHCKVIVNADPDRILLNHDNLTLPVGSKASLAAWVFPVTALQDYKLAADNPNIAQIDGNEVTALSTGATNITALTPNGRIANLSLLVVPPQISKKTLSLSDASLVLTRGQMYTVLAYAPENDYITWSLSGSSVIQHLGDGLILALAPGEATLTAADAHGNTASCKITVNIFADRLIIYPYRPRILLVGEQFTANAVLEPVDIFLNQVQWLADNPAVVNLRKEGDLSCLITGMVEGVTQLSAQSADGKVVNQWLISVQKTRNSVEDFPQEPTLPPSVSFHDGTLTFNNLTAYRAFLSTLSGRTIDGFLVLSDYQTHSLSLPPGVYILAAVHQSARFVTKFVVR